MAINEENILLHTDGLEERVMKATGLTKNVVCKMLCDANETEDEVEKARILSHFIWHMPAGQLANTDTAKSLKKTLIEDLANEIGTEVPEDIMSSLTIEVKEEKPIDEPIDDTIDDSINDPINEPISKTVGDPINKPISKTVGEPINEPINTLSKTKEEELVEEDDVEGEDIALGEEEDYKEDYNDNILKK